jgi:formylglycine-generating enzyme required for sulfatase activity
MKKIFYTLFVFGLITTLSFNSTVGDWFDLKQFVQVKTDVWVSKYEVSNAEYKKFITDVSKNNEAIFVHTVLPDTLVWRNDISNTEPFVKFYFRNNSYDHYPVVGVSYEAANAYCKWLTDQYNQYPRKKFKKVLFKLLSKDEWVFAANKGDTTKVYTWGTGFIQNNRKQYLCNYKHTVFTLDSATKKYIESPEPNAIKGTTITAPIHSFYPNSFGIYNMCGNVAEMIEEKGIAKGGSFLEPAYNVRISSEKIYNKTQADIGFRIALKIIEK